MCDYGVTAPRSECTAAAEHTAAAAGKEMGRSNLVTISGGTCMDGAAGQVPLGCSVQSGGDFAAHYKLSEVMGGAGCHHSMYQLVCSDGENPSLRLPSLLLSKVPIIIFKSLTIFCLFPVDMVRRFAHPSGRDRAASM